MPGAGKRIRGSSKASSSKAEVDPQGSDIEIVSPTPKRSRKDSVAPGFVPVNTRSSTPPAVSAKSKAPKKQKGSPKKPVVPKIPLNQFIPSHLRTFMKDSKGLEDWKGRCFYFFAHIFFVRRGFMSDELRQIVTLVVPHNLRLKQLELCGFFERAHQEFVGWFTERIKDTGREYLQSAGGQTWKEAYLKAKFGKKNKPVPQIFEHGAVHWTLLDMVNVFRKLLFAVPTVQSPANTVSWLDDDGNSDWWANTLRDCISNATIPFVCAEVVSSGCYSDLAIKKDLIAAHNPPLPEGGFRWPPMLPEYKIIDYAQYLSSPRTILNSYASGETSDKEATPRPQSPPLFAELDKQFTLPQNAPDGDFVLPQDVLEGITHASDLQEKTYVDGFMEGRFKQMEGDIFARPLLPAQVESSINQPEVFHMPSYYADEVSNTFASLNLWGKAQMCLRLLDQETERLENVSWLIHQRMELMETEKDRLRTAITDIELKRSVLENLYEEQRKSAQSLKKEQEKLAALKSIGRRSTAPSIVPFSARPVKPSTSTFGLIGRQDQGRGANPFAFRPVSATPLPESTTRRSVSRALSVASTSSPHPSIRGISTRGTHVKNEPAPIQKPQLLTSEGDDEDSHATDTGSEDERYGAHSPEPDDTQFLDPRGLSHLSPSTAHGAPPSQKLLTESQDSFDNSSFQSITAADSFQSAAGADSLRALEIEESLDLIQ